jgi:hypothetical protein
MRLASIGLAAAITLSALTLAPPAVGTTTADPFGGRWESIDAGDGSYQTLRVRGAGVNGRHAVRLFDTAASQACSGEAASVQGTGSVSGRRMSFYFTIACPGSGKGPTTGLVGPIVFRYHAGSDTLTDGSGTVWHRIN